MTMIPTPVLLVRCVDIILKWFGVTQFVLDVLGFDVTMDGFLSLVTTILQAIISAKNLTKLMLINDDNKPSKGD